MRIHRFYIYGQLESFLGNPQGFSVDSEKQSELIHQLFHVFRYKPGQEVILVDGTGMDYRAQITEISKKGVRFSIHEAKKGLNQIESFKKQICLCFSLIKKDNTELILQKCTELGVTEFHPLVSERSEKKDFNTERGEKIIIEAIEQSGWSVLPKLNNVEDLESVVEKTKGMKQIVFHTNIIEDSTPIAPSVEDEEKIALFIGPEGGWSENEINLFRQHDVEFQSLGHSVLRAETAAIASVSKYL